MTTPPGLLGEMGEARLQRALAGWERGPYMAFLHPVTEALMAAVSIRPGLRVLDVGTGYGDPALAIAAAVGPSGRVVGIDHDSQSLAFARQRAAARGLQSVSFEEMDALHLRFADRSFDAVVSRLVVIYFPDPLPLLREILRVLVPGGRAAVATWTRPERNPLMNTPFEVLRRHLPPVSLPPQAPDRMDTRDPQVLQLALERAGFMETGSGVVSLVASMRTEDAATYWEERRAGSPASLQALARLTPAQQATAESEVVEAIRQLIVQGRATGEIGWAAGTRPPHP